MPPTAADSLLLPEGARLVHIGPPKTGTTLVQGAFHARREEIRGQGVRYAGSVRHSAPAILAVTGRPSPQQGEPPRIDKWRGLVREIHGAREPRVVLSSEFLADAEPEAISRIVTDLGADAIQVVVTVRPLARILPSQWQQYVQSGLRASYDEWLQQMFAAKPAPGMTPTFWRRHRHDRLVERWAAAVGPERVTVVVLDEADRDGLLRVFERLVGLTEGTLAAEEDLENRSMTLPEIELIREFNRAFRKEGLGTPLHTKVMRYGAALYMKQRRPSADEARIETPQWALDRALEVEAEIVAGIGASGVRVVGDLDCLAAKSEGGVEGAAQPPVMIPPAIAARAMMGVLISTGVARAGTGPNGVHLFARAEPIELARLSNTQLASVLLARGRGEVARRVRSRIRRRP